MSRIFAPQNETLYYDYAYLMNMSITNHPPSFRYIHAITTDKTQTFAVQRLLMYFFSLSVHLFDS